MASGASQGLKKWAAGEQEAVRVVVVAPAMAWRAGLRALLNSDDRIQIVGELASLSELELIENRIEVLVLAGSGLRLDELGEFASAGEPFSVLLLVEGEPANARVLQELPLRAWGILPGETTAEEMIAAVHALAEGLMVGSPVLLSSLLAGQSLSSSVELEPLIEMLTEREAEVLQLLAQGLANKQIAASLGISENTVKFHVSAIFAKLGATSRTEAVRIGIRRGLVVL